MFVLAPLIFSVFITALPFDASHDSLMELAPASGHLDYNGNGKVRSPRSQTPDEARPDSDPQFELTRDDQLQMVLHSLPTICTGLEGQRVTEDKAIMERCLKNFATRANDPAYGTDEKSIKRFQKRQLLDQLRASRADRNNNNGNRADRNNNNNNANRADRANNAGANKAVAGTTNSAATPATTNSFASASKSSATANNLETIDLAIFTQSIDVKDVVASIPASSTSPVVATKAPASPGQLATTSTAAAPAAPGFTPVTPPPPATKASLPAGSTGVPDTLTSQQLAVKIAPVSAQSINAGKAAGVATPASGLVAIKAAV